jgi:hypothetical protein
MVNLPKPLKQFLSTLPVAEPSSNIKHPQPASRRAVKLLPRRQRLTANHTNLQPAPNKK